MMGIRMFFLIFLTYSVFIFAGCGDGSGGSSNPTPSDLTEKQYIIADHTVVDQYDKIPQYWIDQVKKMWINIPGESHSAAYRDGLIKLQESDSRFAAKAIESDQPEDYTGQYLRTCKAVRSQYNSWIWNTGENIFWTTSTGVQINKNHVTYCETNNLHISAIGFGWCWDMVRGDPSDNLDLEYGCHWYGSTDGGEKGWWGLDEGDSTINCKTYCQQIDDYNNFCQQKNYTTKFIFTTGTVDNENYFGERAYQGYLKNEYIRNYVKQAGSSRILFDYADILCYNDNGQLQIYTWNGNKYPVIHSINDPDETGHISYIGAIRLAKAQWWLLARIAGWDGN